MEHELSFAETFHPWLYLDFCKPSINVGKTGGFWSNRGVFAWRGSAGRCAAREGGTMPAIVEFPQVVCEAVEELGE